MRYRIFLLGLLFMASPLFASQQPQTLEEQTRAISSELRCVVCQNLSVADSPSEMAKEMRAIVREQLKAGKSPEEIKQYFVSKYGEWVLLAPETKGFSLLVWVLPFAVLIAGLILGLWAMRRWTQRKSQQAAVNIDPKISAWLQKEMTSPDLTEPDPEDTSPRAELLREGMRFLTEIKELEFDFQAGKLGESDYRALRQEVENKAAVVLQQLETLPVKRPVKSVSKEARSAEVAKKAAENRRSVRQWQLVTGGVFLLGFGIAVGVFLTQSVRPRGSAGESMTGGFLTGTRAGSSDVPSLLKQGKAAFEKQQWSTAIKAFKNVLAVEPDNPEAHTYMAYILVQAGHTDGALDAFDKALSVAPNFQLALWGKGMALYKSKQDYAGARQVFQKLLKVTPPGQGRAEIEKVLAEIPQSNNAPLPASTDAREQAAPSSRNISGKISIDPKIRSQVDSQATLFIIAHNAGTNGGPPVAVKKIDRPAFPLSYSLGSDSSMMQGAPFPEKVTVSVRLDKDGNAMTRQPGDLFGEYRKNPVAAGSKDINIVIDQVAK